MPCLGWVSSVLACCRSSPVPPRWPVSLQRRLAGVATCHHAMLLHYSNGICPAPLHLVYPSPALLPPSRGGWPGCHSVRVFRAGEGRFSKERRTDNGLQLAATQKRFARAQCRVPRNGACLPQPLPALVVYERALESIPGTALPHAFNIVFLPNCRHLCCTRRASPTAGRRCGRCSLSWARSTGEGLIGCDWYLKDD